MREKRPEKMKLYNQEESVIFFGQIDNPFDSFLSKNIVLPNLKGSRARVLDLGCGTGISTRQLVRDGAKIFGADKDANMIGEAKKEASSIQYVVAEAGRLPFGDASFDALTSFAAFHWFTDADSICLL